MKGTDFGGGVSSRKNVLYAYPVHFIFPVDTGLSYEGVIPRRIENKTQS